MACTWFSDEGVGRVFVGDGNICVSVRVELFWQWICCSNTRPDFDSQSGFCSCRVLGSISPRILWEYNLATIIAIRPLTHSRKFEMASSIFFAIIWLKSESTNKTSFPIMPSTEKANGEKNVDCGNACHYYPYLCLPTILDLIHWIVLVSIFVSIFQSYVDDRVIMDFP